MLEKLYAATLARDNRLSNLKIYYTLTYCLEGEERVNEIGFLKMNVLCDKKRRLFNNFLLLLIKYLLSTHLP